MSSSNPNIQLAAHSKTYRTGTQGFSSIAWAFFQGGITASPGKPFLNNMAYVSIAGLMTVEDSTFAHYGQVCGTQKDAIFSVSPGNEDGSHPVKTWNLRREPSVNQDSLVYIPHASLGKVNPSDCVDMDCGGKKKALLKDLDGSFLGAVGEVLPFAEQEWDGDTRHGVGDYRIPKAVQGAPNGRFINLTSIVNHRGLFPAQSCVNRTATWQAYECTGANADHEMMILENMDADTELRRLSPVAVISEKYVDLVNGPQDHGWCSGYTCQKRLSTFMTLVNIGRHHDIYFSSTSPQHLRIFLLNSVPSQAVTLAIYYKTPKRMDTYANGQYVMPKNAYIDANNRQLLHAPTTPGQYHPLVSDISGTNFRDRDWLLEYMTVAGPDPVELKMAEVVIVSFELPAMKVSQFFGDQLADNLAALLGVPPDKVRTVEAVGAGGSSLYGRRRRQTSSSTYVLETGTLSALQLDLASSIIVDSTQLGNLSTLLNTTILNVYLMEYIPGSNTQAWGTFAQQGSDGSYYIQKPAYLTIQTQPVPLHEGAAFSTQPEIQAIDVNGNPIEFLGSRNYPWEITAVIKNGTNPSATVVGTTTIPFANGWANFTDIGISHYGSYQLDFVITKPAAANNFTIASQWISVPKRQLAVQFSQHPNFITAGSTFSLQCEIVDAVTGARVQPLNWRNLSFTGVLSMNSHSPSGAVISSTSTFTASSGRANFNNLIISTVGGHVFDVSVTSSPAEYQLSGTSDAVFGYSSGYTQAAGGTSTVQMRFSGDFNTLVNGSESLFLARLMSGLNTKLGSSHIYYDQFSVYADAVSGYTRAQFDISGNSTSRNNTVEQLWLEIQYGMSVVVNSNTLTALVELEIDGLPYSGIMVEVADDKEFPIGAIVGIAVVCVLATGAVIGYFLIKKKKSGSQKVLDDGPDFVKSPRSIPPPSVRLERTITPSAMSLHLSDEKREALRGVNSRFSNY